MKYSAIKADVQSRWDKTFREHGVIWAFSKERLVEQIDKAKAPYVSIGNGGYMPKANFDSLMQSLKELDQYEKEAIAKAKLKSEEVILHELNNFECFHSLDLTDAMDNLRPLGYTLAEVRKVFKKHQGLVTV